ncbi:hypothetical protein [Pseudovibrio brasiliensis]|uniref:Uncharacterized protein n=1 Tax=Pseudovibrio brasiliensis TaxID=1898042 RepID=A0ABX8AVE0_9HYPH|nr:hypothetical protein [Pseudovibrio brasiliensis]QUS59032.1 hypothetical protein KGB56_25800 [Pseudovibrio brasiliensis]
MKTDIQITQYPFPDERGCYNAVQEAGFCLFPRELEEDDHVFFHGTAFENWLAILSKGFMSSNELTGGELDRVSYARKSSLSLGYAANARSAKTDGKGVVIAVRFENLADTRLQVTDGGLLFAKRCQPEIIGYYIVPSFYHHL